MDLPADVKVQAIKNHETVTINASFDVRCFNLYLRNILTKSVKTDRCTDITFKLTLL